MLDSPNRAAHADHPSRTNGIFGAWPLIDVWTPVAESVEGGNLCAFHAGDEMAQSWMRLVSDRLAKDAALPQQILACGSLNELFLVYLKFWQQAAKDYSNEFFAISDAACDATCKALNANSPTISRTPVRLK